MTVDQDLDARKPISHWWRQAVILVMILGFSLLTLVTVKTYAGAPPIPDRVADASGATLFSGADIKGGQEVFMKYALMEHGTIWGHGAYLGPDYSAEYLHRLAEIGRDTLARAQFGRAFKDLAPGQALQVGEQLKLELKQNRYRAADATLVFTAAEADSWRAQDAEWKRYFNSDQGAPGLPAHYIRNDAELTRLNAYFAWATWATVANRPGAGFSYTNNWPFEPMVGNGPTASAYLWSALSLLTLVGGLGLILFLFGKFDFLGWGSGAHRPVAPGRLQSWVLTPSQKALGLYFAVVMLLFLLQAGVGGVLAHYRVETQGFYGFDLARILPYNLARTWHLQLAIFWIATSWVAGGLFLAPLVGGAEPRGQRAGVLVLLGALAIVVFGSLGGE